MSASGTAVGLSFFFLILGAAPFVIYHFFGDRIKAFIASRRGTQHRMGGLPWSDLALVCAGVSGGSDEFPPAGSVQAPAAAVGGSGYQTF
jgi:hypothetical protein